jgi:Fe-S oxidoreductase
MAAMKIEFLYQYYQSRRRPLKDRLVAHLPRYAAVMARFAMLANLRNRIPGLAYLGERVAGLSARRSLPTWRRDVFRGRPEAPEGAQGPDLVLLADTFNTYFEPENLRAAISVFNAANYRTVVAEPVDGGRPLCCGRTYLATGMVDEARAEARRTLTALMPFVQRGIPIVGLEPSCLLTLRDEFRSLIPGAGTDALSDAALTFEEFLVREKAGGRLKPNLGRPLFRRALVHGHCHQKAFDVLSHVHDVLSWVPDLEVEAIESSCCGMAGAFGFAAKHVDISLKMAEASLLPAVRASGEDTIVVADGTSCRHQIKDGAQREALHVARILAAALED